MKNKSIVHTLNAKSGINNMEQTLASHKIMTAGIIYEIIYATYSNDRNYLNTMVGMDDFTVADNVIYQRELISGYNIQKRLLYTFCGVVITKKDDNINSISKKIDHLGLHELRNLLIHFVAHLHYISHNDGCYKVLKKLNICIKILTDSIKLLDNNGTNAVDLLSKYNDIDIKYKALQEKYAKIKNLLD